jgi:hypothetical protein
MTLWLAGRGVYRSADDSYGPFSTHLAELVSRPISALPRKQTFEGGGAVRHFGGGDPQSYSYLMLTVSGAVPPAPLRVMLSVQSRRNQQCPA